jgi:hypothetical protein
MRRDFNMTSFETIAKHFAGKLKTNVYFESKCTPHTDGRDVYLPKSLPDENLLATVGATIHECYHIKYTNSEEYRKIANEKYDDKIQETCTNLAEDIRIDNKVFKDYENSRYIYSKLVETVFLRRQWNKSAVTEEFINVLQHVYLYGVGFEQFYFNPEMMKEIMAKNKTKIDNIIDDLKRAKKTADIKSSVSSLKDLVKDLVKENLSKKDKDGKGVFDNQIKNKEQEVKDLQNKIDGIKKEEQELTKKINDNYDKYNKDQKKMWGTKDSKERKEISEEMNKVRDEQKTLSRKKSIRNTKSWKVEREKREVEREIEGLKELSKKDVDVSTAINSELTSEDIQEMFNGFKSLENSDSWKIKREEVIDFEDNMKEIFKRLEHKKVINNSSGKININKIYKIFKSEEDYNDIFVEDRIKETYNNKIVMLLDVSGSMKNESSTKSKVLLECVTNLTRLIEKTKEQYNIEYEVGVFADSPKIIKTFSETITEEDLKSRYSMNFSGGGTEIIPALEEAYKTLEENSNVKDRKFILVFTDGEFDDSSMKKILEEYNARNERHIFIGIGDLGKSTVFGAGDKFFKEILMGRLVNNTKEMEKVLIDGFDRMI